MSVKDQIFPQKRHWFPVKQRLILEYHCSLHSCVPLLASLMTSGYEQSHMSWQVWPDVCHVIQFMDLHYTYHTIADFWEDKPAQNVNWNPQDGNCDQITHSEKNSRITVGFF